MKSKREIDMKTGVGISDLEAMQLCCLHYLGYGPFIAWVSYQ